jgi:hypothetical protein
LVSASGSVPTGNAWVGPFTRSGHVALTLPLALTAIPHHRVHLLSLCIAVSNWIVRVESFRGSGSNRGKWVACELPARGVLPRSVRALLGSPPAMQLFFAECLVTAVDRHCGLVVRVRGYRTEMYSDSCEVRTEFICYVEESRPPLWSSGQSS